MSEFSSPVPLPVRYRGNTETGVIIQLIIEYHSNFTIIKLVVNTHETVENRLEERIITEYHDIRTIDSYFQNVRNSSSVNGFVYSGARYNDSFYDDFYNIYRNGSQVDINILNYPPSATLYLFHFVEGNEFFPDLGAQPAEIINREALENPEKIMPDILAFPEDEENPNKTAILTIFNSYIE